MAWVRAGFVNYKKGCTRLAATSDKVYQLLVHGWWFSPGTPASSTTKTGRHDIAKILLKVALNTKNQIKSIRNVLKRNLNKNIYLSLPLLERMVLSKKDTGKIGSYTDRY